MDSCKILQFRSRKAEFEANAKARAVKDTAKYLIDSCDGDFAIIFKTEDVEHLFDNIQDERFFIAMSNWDDGFVTSFEEILTNFDDIQGFDLDVR